MIKRRLIINCAFAVIISAFFLVGCASVEKKYESVNQKSETEMTTEVSNEIEAANTETSDEDEEAKTEISGEVEEAKTETKAETVLLMLPGNDPAPEYVENKIPGSDVSFYTSPSDGEGTLSVLINRVSLENNFFDIGISPDIIKDPSVSASVCIGSGNEMLEYGFPDYAFADWDTGEMIEGAYIIAIDITVTNIDASSERYVDSGELLPLGVTPGPENEEKAYVFRADNLNLVDMSRKGAPFQGSFVWFTGYGQREEAPGAFYLPQGEATDMTLYYVIGENDGKTLSSLGLSAIPALNRLPKAIFPLTLDN